MSVNTWRLSESDYVRATKREPEDKVADVVSFPFIVNVDAWRLVRRVAVEVKTLFFGTKGVYDAFCFFKRPVPCEAGLDLGEDA